MKVTIKGFLNELTNPVQSRNGNYYFSAIIFLPKPRNEFGEEYGAENYYNVRVFDNQSLEKFNKLKDMLNNKVQVEAYFNGRKYKNAGDHFVVLNELNLTNIHILE